MNFNEKSNRNIDLPSMYPFFKLDDWNINTYKIYQVKTNGWTQKITIILEIKNPFLLV